MREGRGEEGHTVAGQCSVRRRDSLHVEGRLVDSYSSEAEGSTGLEEVRKEEEQPPREGEGSLGGQG